MKKEKKVELKKKILKESEIAFWSLIYYQFNDSWKISDVMKI